MQNDEKKFDFKSLSLDELQDMQEKLTNYAERLMNRKRTEALQTIQNLVKEYELSYDEVMSAIRITAKRGKAPAIFRNPENWRQTWSGKGDPPDWYTNALDKEALRITKDPKE